MAKPFSMDELVARIEALGRRGATPTAADLLEVGDLHMDVHHRRVSRAGRPIALSPREFDVLQLLMQEPGRVFSRTELCERVWQRDHEYDTRTVEIFITRLRKKVDSGFATPLIHTVCAPWATPSAPPNDPWNHSSWRLSRRPGAWPAACRYGAGCDRGKGRAPESRRTRPVMNKRYGIVAYGGVLSPYPPVAVVYLEGALPAGRRRLPRRGWCRRTWPSCPTSCPCRSAPGSSSRTWTTPTTTSFPTPRPSDSTWGATARTRRPIPSEVFDVAGLVTLRCDIHEHMRAIILVLDTPHFVLSDADGRYRLDGPARRPLRSEGLAGQPDDARAAGRPARRRRFAPTSRDRAAGAVPRRNREASARGSSWR